MAGHCPRLRLPCGPGDEAGAALTASPAAGAPVRGARVPRGQTSVPGLVPSSVGHRGRHTRSSSEINTKGKGFPCNAENHKLTLLTSRKRGRNHASLTSPAAAPAASVLWNLRLCRAAPGGRNRGRPRSRGSHASAPPARPHACSAAQGPLQNRARCRFAWKALAKYLRSLNFSFPICKIEVIVPAAGLAKGLRAMTHRSRTARPLAQRQEHVKKSDRYLLLFLF